MYMSLAICIYMAYTPYFRFKKNNLRDHWSKQPPTKNQKNFRKESTSDVEELDGVTWIWLTHQSFRNPKEPPVEVGTSSWNPVYISKVYIHRLGCIKNLLNMGYSPYQLVDSRFLPSAVVRISSSWSAGNLFKWVVQLFKCSCWVPFRGKKHIQRTYLRTKKMPAVSSTFFVNGSFVMFKGL